MKNKKLKWLWDNVLSRWQEHYLNWNDARLAKDFAKADIYRNKLIELNIL